MDAGKPRGRGRPRYAGRQWHRAVRFWMHLQTARVKYRHCGEPNPYQRALEDTAAYFRFQSPEAASQWLWRVFKSAPREVRDCLPNSRDLVWVAEGGYVAERGELPE